MDTVLLTIVLSPLLASVVAGLAGKQIGRAGSHTITILGVGLSCALSLYVLKAQVLDGMGVYNETLYQWMSVGGISMEVGFKSQSSFYAAFKELTGESPGNYRKNLSKS